MGKHDHENDYASTTGTTQGAGVNAPGTPTDEERLDKIELVRTKTGVTFEEARAALELTGYDVLDAVVLLERQGKTASATARYATAGAGSAADADAQRMSQAQSDYERSTKKTSFEEGWGRFIEWVKRVLRKSIDTSLVATRRGRQIFTMPILIVILLVIFAFWIVVPLLIISLFFDFRYHFDGVGTITVDLNDLTNKASDGAEYLKRNVKDAYEGRDAENGTDDASGTNGGTSAR